MKFANERQQRAVMAQYSKWNNESRKIFDKSSVPLIVRAGASDEETLQRQYDKIKNDLRKEEEKIKRKALNEATVFSEKRGSVPLLDTTFVIRGGSPKERQVVKKLLDAIGNETAMSDINTVRIEPDLKEQFVINQEARSISVRSGDLHIKSGEFPIDLAMTILANAMVLKNAAISDEVALDRAKESVSLYLIDMQHKEKLKKEKEAIDVYRVGADRQSDFEVSSIDGPVVSPIEVKLTQENPNEFVSSSLEQPPMFKEPADVMFQQ